MRIIPRSNPEFPTRTNRVGTADTQQRAQQRVPLIIRHLTHCASLATQQAEQQCFCLVIASMRQQNRAVACEIAQSLIASMTCGGFQRFADHAHRNHLPAQTPLTNLANGTFADRAGAVLQAVINTHDVCREFFSRRGGR